MPSGCRGLDPKEPPKDSVLRACLAGSLQCHWWVMDTLVDGDSEEEIL